jgi:hypothetical protein
MRMRGHVRLVPLLAAVALVTAPGAAAGAVLVDQLNNDGGGGVGSTDHGTGKEDRNTQAADDFVVDPASQGWNVDKVEVEGNSAPALSDVGVYFYPDAGGVPSITLTDARTVIPSSGLTNGSFVMPLSPPVHLAPGTYWVSVQAHASDPTDDFWAWEFRAVHAGQVWAFRNPGNFYNTGCKTWTASTVCYPFGPAQDLMFRLSGTTVAPPPPVAPAPPGLSAPPTTGSPGTSSPAPNLIDSTPPVQTTKAAKVESVKKGSLSLVVSASENSTATVSATVSLPRLAKVYRIGPISKTIRANHPTKIVLKIKRTTLKRIRSALGAHKRLKASLTVNVSDVAKNTATTKRTIRLAR